MITTIDEQLTALIVSLFAGIAVGLLFDLYRVIVCYIKPSKAFLYFTDLLFWIVTSIEAFAILLNADFADVRLYTFAGIGIGTLIHFKLFSTYITRFYRGAIYAVCKMFRIGFMLLLLPVKFFSSALWNLANHIGSRISKTAGSVRAKRAVGRKNLKKV